jgi:cell wall-associated NlpC family hydrolase
MRYLIIFCLFFVTLSSFGQDKKIDKLEMFYDQGHYSKVVRKSNALLADPYYDFSGMPSYYKSLSLFRMAGDIDWFKRHEETISEAIQLYKDFLENEKAGDYVFAHYFEIASIKTYLVDLEGELKTLRYTKQATLIKEFRENELKSVNARPDKKQKSTTPVQPKVNHEDDSVVNEKELDFRGKMVTYSKTLIGTKYAWSGRDTDGFDCSGLAGHVYQKYGILIPRTASEQLSEAKKIDLKDAQKGDLIFFGSGKNISHVGILISEKGEPLVMVHASTSKGVIITEIEKSSYWKPKIKGAGTYL